MASRSGSFQYDQEETPQTQTAAPVKDWVFVQKKTFTKWVNSHLTKIGASIGDVQNEFKDGIKLMQLIKALYGIEMPKHNKAPRMRPQQLDNISLAFDMIAKAQIKTNFLKTHHLADCDLKMILGMIWAIILDYQIKGISIEDFSAKEGLLLWCQRKTKGYRDVKVDNFHTSWKDGLALCALIHHHRPDLIDFDSLDKANKKQNLQLAFDVAQKELGIAPLLDAEDICEVELPDERSIMTYISEFFHKFSSQNQREVSANRIKKFVEFHQAIEQMQNNYVSNANDILHWIEEKINFFRSPVSEGTVEEVKAFIDQFKQYKVSEKRTWNEAKLDNETLFNNTQIRLRTNNRKAWTAPNGVSVEEVDQQWNKLAEAEKDRSKALRESLIRAKDKLRHEFADQAEDFAKWINGLKNELIQEHGGSLQEQLAFIKGKSDEIHNNDKVAPLEQTSKRIEDAGIDDNPYTDYTTEELLLLFDQVKGVAEKKLAFLENQLASQARGGISPEKLGEFREAFKHFDKDNSNSLDKLEFKACLASLGLDFTEDEFTKLVGEVSKGADKIYFDNFIDFVVKLTEDTDSAEQIKKSFKQLASDRDTVNEGELYVTPLQKNHVDYLINRMPASHGSYDYVSYTDNCFA